MEPSPASSPAPTPAPTAPQWLTLQMASCNLLNLALPGQVFYDGQDAYDTAEHERKLAWLGGMLARLNAEVCGFQEVWHEAALKAAVARSGQRLGTVVAPGAEAGASGTPRVGLASKLPLVALESISDFHPADVVPVPEIGPHTRFERPLLHAELRLKTGAPLHVLVCHLKSKRPKHLQDASGQPLEDRDDPLVTARATLRSLLMRAAEAAALRRVVVGITARAAGDAPLVLLGDLNDGPQAVTTQMIAAVQAVAYDKAARDTALYHAWDVATEPALKRSPSNVGAYSHVHQGWPELLDQIWVSEEFVAGSRRAIGDVLRVEVFNDHLHESRERWRSDHGFVRALLRLRTA
jgi:endonuclease/exonuclease/phosphatase family metal-dependent hydrolase